jgi:SAM-dependent methyltransferase
LTSTTLEERIVSSLSAVDWNFPTTTTLRTGVHSLHWFPGNFVPYIPSFLIQVLSSRSALVLDPFCGSGTTGVEAALVSRNAVQCDANRVSGLICRAKIALLSSVDVRREFPKLAEPLVWSFSPSDEGGNDGRGTDPELKHWFHPDTLSQLRSIWLRIESCQHQDVRLVLEALFSNTLLSCASTGRAITSGGGKRRNHWGWVADNVLPKHRLWHDAKLLFWQSIRRTAEVLKATPLICDIGCEFVRADARALPFQDETVDLIVTSPPYLGMIDYATGNRLTYLWFGWPIKADRDLEIGARSRRNRKNEATEYSESIAASVREISRVLKTGGLCAIVIGASQKFPGMSMSVVDTFAGRLRLVWGPSGRVPTRRRISDRKGTEPTEFICVFKKDG